MAEIKIKAGTKSSRDELRSYLWHFRNRVKTLDEFYEQDTNMLAKLSAEEKDCLAEYSSAHVNVERANERYRSAEKKLAAARTELSGFTLSYYMNDMFRDFATMVERLQDSLKDLAALVKVYEEFFAYFSHDGVKWSRFTDMLEKDEFLENAFPNKDFEFFESVVRGVWECFSLPVRNRDGMDSAMETISDCLECWEKQERPRRYAENSEFLAKVLDGLYSYQGKTYDLSMALRKPKAFFILETVEDDEDKSPPAAEPPPKDEVAAGLAHSAKRRRAKVRAAKRRILLTDKCDIAKYGYNVRGDREVIEWRGKAYRLTAPKAVKKVNELIQQLYADAKKPDIKFTSEDAKNFRRGTYRKFYDDCVRRIKVPDKGDPQVIITLPRAHLRLPNEK